MTIAYVELKDKIASFCFQQELILPEIDINNLYDEVIDCDLLLMVIADNKAITEAEKNFLLNLDISMMSKQFLIIDVNAEIILIFIDLILNSDWIAYLTEINLPDHGSYLFTII